MWETILWRLIIGWECFDGGSTTNPPSPSCRGGGIENFTPDYLPPSLLDIGGGWSISAPSTTKLAEGRRVHLHGKDDISIVFVVIYIFGAVTSHCEESAQAGIRTGSNLRQAGVLTIEQRLTPR